ncbi:UNVERIFIED_CONTAM: hypothetical protein Slati_0186000 [Sesamum latifolium]|uniref:Uncharacterized protein n=1 Tax=Sesamum latifolium TaxID=2727402 RepID=A0AAW2YB55_9LAMI
MSRNCSWKDKFFFIHPPAVQKWPFPCEWRDQKLGPEIYGWGLDDDIINSLTIYWYQAYKLLMKKVLKLASLTPTPLHKGTLPANVEVGADSSNPLLLLHQLEIVLERIKELLLNRYSLPQILLPILPESISESFSKPCSKSFSKSNSYFSRPRSRSSSQALEPKDKEVTEGPSEPKKRKKKHHKNSRSSRSSKRSKSHSAKKKAKAVAEKAEEEDNLKLIRELTDWWKATRKELRTPACWSAVMEGEKLIPWLFSDQISILKIHVGQDSLKIYKSSLLPHDQALLPPYSHTQKEKRLAHALSQVVFLFYYPATLLLFNTLL